MPSVEALTPPWLPVLAVSEPTYEGLCKLFATSHPSLGVFSSKGGRFIGRHGMADDAKLHAAGYRTCGTAEPSSGVRADGTTILPDRRLSMRMMAQPDVAGGWLSDPLLADQGMFPGARLSA